MIQKIWIDFSGNFLQHQLERYLNIGFQIKEQMLQNITSANITNIITNIIIISNITCNICVTNILIAVLDDEKKWRNKTVKY